MNSPILLSSFGEHEHVLYREFWNILDFGGFIHIKYSSKAQYKFHISICFVF